MVVGSYSVPGEPDIRPGERLTLEGDNVRARSCAPAGPPGLDDCDGEGTIAARVRELGVQSGVGAPIIVDERVWGIAVVRSSQPEPLSPDSEERVAEFAKRVATAIAAATAHAARSRGDVGVAQGQRGPGLSPGCSW